MLRFPTSFLLCCLNTRQRKSWLKSVEMELTRLDMEPEERSQLFKEKVAQLEPHFTKLREAYCNAPQRGEAVWDFLRNFDLSYEAYLIQKQWPAKLAPVLDELKLENLTVGVRGISPRDTDRRLGESALEAFNRGVANGLPDILIVTGCLEDDEEMERLISKWSQERETRRHSQGYYLNRTREWIEGQWWQQQEIIEAIHQVAELSKECSEDSSSEGTRGHFGCRLQGFCMSMFIVYFVLFMTRTGLNEG